MFRATANVITALVFCFLPSYGIADAPSAPVPITEILQSSRPPNLFKLAYQRQEGLCESIGKELNVASEPGTNRGNYFGMLTATAGNAFWSMIPDNSDVKGLYVEYTLANIFNDGTSHVVFRAHGSLGGREFDSLYADPEPDNGGIKAAIHRTAPGGSFDDVFAAPPGKLQDYYAIANAGLAANRGLPRFDIVKTSKITYIVEGSFYELAPFDAILVYVGHPNHEFSLECSFDPQTVIPTSPPE